MTYSIRKAREGSTREALHAGMMLAIAETPSRTTEAAIHDTGSLARIPYSVLPMVRAAIAASTNPNARPAVATSSPCCITSVNTDAVKQAMVNARRMPSAVVTERMRTMRDSVRGHDVHAWAADFLGRLRRTHLHSVETAAGER